MVDGEREIEGYACECTYDNRNDPIFPFGFISFRLRGVGGDKQGRPFSYLIMGSRSPPIVDGLYVRGKAFPQNDGNKGIVQVVSELSLFEQLSFADGLGQKFLARYKFK